MVQEYIPNPLLIDGRKFDLRLYVCVTSVEPLIAYLFDDGLGRFATHLYQRPSNANKAQKTVHLTNYSVNKTDGESIEEYKWSFQDILAYLEQNFKGTPVRMWEGVYSQNNASRNERSVSRPGAPRSSLPPKYKRQNVEVEQRADPVIPDPGQEQMSVRDIALENIKHVIRMTLIACEPTFVAQTALCRCGGFPRKQFGFYGFDLMFLDDLSVKLIEVNVNPSTATENDIDKRIKFWMLRDMLHLVGIPAMTSGTGVVVPALSGDPG